MRAFLVPALLSVAVSVPAGLSIAGPRAPLDLPVLYPYAGASSAPAPVYAGDVVEVRLTREASRTVWGARAGRLARVAATRLDRLGLADLDRAAAALGGVWFEPEFPGEVPPRDTEGRDFAAFLVAHLPRGLALESALDGLGGAAGVAGVQPIAILPVSTVPNDSLFSSSTWFYQLSRNDIHAPEAWNITTGDTAVVVAILDTGLLFGHPDLTGTTPGSLEQIWTNWKEAGGVPGVDDDSNGRVDDVHGWDFVSLSDPNAAVMDEDWRDQDGDPNDFEGHGTAVAGVIGALTDNVHGVAGTAWTVHLMPLRVGWAVSGGGAVRMDFVTSAIRYATLAGARIINCSFQSRNLASLDLALDEATAAGVTVIVAAGNDNTNDTQLEYMSSRPDVISVASTGPTDAVSSFSNWGPQIDLAAPGEGIALLGVAHGAGDSLTSRVPRYWVAGGTSFSAPMVSGVAALVQARQRALGLPPLSPEEMRLRLTQTADDISAQNPTRIGQYGSGRLNAFRAVAALAPAAVPDLRATAVTDSSVTLRWTATGADGNVGRPQLYVVHAATSPLTAATFAAAPYERIVDATVDAGGDEELLFKVLERSKRYWFALEAFDAAGNPSALSNVIVAETRGIVLLPEHNPSRVPVAIHWQGSPQSGGAAQQLGIYDLAGRRVRTLELGTGGTGIAQWDGRDDGGNRVAAGLYLLRLASGGERVRARLVLLP